MKRILYIAPQPFFQIRGTPIAHRDMLSILSERYEIDLITYPFGENYPIKNIKHFRSPSWGFKYVSIGASFRKAILDVGLFLYSFYLALTKKYDFIHASEEAAIFGVVIKKIFGGKLVYDMDSVMSDQVHNSPLIKKFLQVIEGQIIQNTDLILAISSNFEPYCRNIKKDCNFIEIFDLPQINEEENLPQNIKDQFKTDKKIILYIGNGEKYQGLDLLREVALLSPDYDFYIVGTGKSGRWGNVIYIPQIGMKYVSSVMKLADVLISPRSEGTNTPMKIYTYMASGKPIVATNIPAHKLLHHCAYIGELDKYDIKLKIELAVGDKKSLGELSRAKVLSRFSLSAFRSIVLDSYNFE